MKQTKHLLAVSLMATMLITGCNSDKKDNRDHGSGGSHRFDLGWGISQGTPFSEIQKRIDAVPNIVPKTEDNGEYVRRSINQASVCNGSDPANGNPAFISKHFEISSNKPIPEKDLQRIAAIAEVSLEDIARELNIQSPKDLIVHSHRRQLGICITAGTGSNGGGHGSELTARQNHPHGIEYEFTLLKHEIGHLIDSQFNQNQYDFNLYPGWWSEGIAEVIAGSSALSASAWNSQHNDYFGDGNIVNGDDLNDGVNGYAAYDLYSTMVLYLQEQGWDKEALYDFFQSDKWHLDGIPDTDTCRGTGNLHIVDYTGSCSRPDNGDEAFAARFDEFSKKVGEVKSFEHFRDNYRELVSDWLSSK